MPVEVRLREIRSARGISQNELARKLEMSLANVQKIEYGKAKSIPLDTLDRLCQVLKCEVGELLVRIPDDSDGSIEKEQKKIQISDKVNQSKTNQTNSLKHINMDGATAA
ncbi:MAG: helix-turn-helix transcriptional regulator [Stigonema ocellatum SAG 48.90 = DSM 106950]|nr:helix-turn-helix transcriptional regulator [Stigonema ocellatum SAG 48.90 = DSM 106950]